MSLTPSFSCSLFSSVPLSPLAPAGVVEHESELLISSLPCLTFLSSSSPGQRPWLLTANNDADLKSYFAAFPPSPLAHPTSKRLSGRQSPSAACMKRPSNGCLLATPLAALIRVICPISCSRDACVNVRMIPAGVMFLFTQSAAGLIRQFVRKKSEKGT